MEERRSAYRVMVEKSEENSPPGMSEQKWENNIKTYIS
jgi:hypothetical protein